MALSVRVHQDRQDTREQNGEENFDDQCYVVLSTRAVRAVNRNMRSRTGCSRSGSEKDRRVEGMQREREGCTPQGGQESKVVQWGRMALLTEKRRRVGLIGAMEKKREWDQVGRDG